MKTDLISATLDGSTMDDIAATIKQRAQSKFKGKVNVEVKHTGKFTCTVILQTDPGDGIDKEVIEFFKGMASHATLCRPI